MTTSEYGLALMLGLNLLCLAYVFGQMRQELRSLRYELVELRSEFVNVVRGGQDGRIKALEIAFAALEARCRGHHRNDRAGNADE